MWEEREGLAGGLWEDAREVTGDVPRLTGARGVRQSGQKVPVPCFAVGIRRSSEP